VASAPATQLGIIASRATAEPTATRTPETAAPTPEPTPEPARPIVVKGKGGQNTKPFNMPSGDFTVTITGNGDGNVIVDLNARASATGSENLFNEIAHGKYKYETVVYGLVVYGLVEASYYLDVTNDNAWVVTFTPLS
jgi:septal ring-binding cell division protein DamX